MPSKAGRRQGDQVLASLQPRPPLDLASIGLVVSELAQPLGRGHEVERFNELARRRDELSPTESDELYRYRLRRLALRERQLEAALAGGTEEDLRDALADYRRRLRELRAQEEFRRQAGLPAGYEPSDVEQRAAERQVELASQRQRGLIAGWGPPATPADLENVRLPEAPFAPGGDDAPLYLLAPPSLPSEALGRSVATVAAEGADVHLVHDAGEIPRDRPALVLNWGGTDQPPADLVALNRPEAVRISSDQVESLQRLGVLAPAPSSTPRTSTCSAPTRWWPSAGTAREDRASGSSPRTARLASWPGSTSTRSWPRTGASTG